MSRAQKVRSEWILKQAYKNILQCGVNIKLSKSSHPELVSGSH